MTTLLHPSETGSELVELPQNMKRPGRCYQHRDPGPDRHGRTAMEDRTGTPSGRARPCKTPEEAFHRYAKPVGTCLIWQGTLTPSGYPRIRVNGKGARAHRWAWERAHGPIPAGMAIDHTCHNRACVQLSHLRLATPRENSRNRGGADPRNVTTGARNVQKCKGRYQVLIKVDGVKQYFGSYGTIARAAQVAEEKRRELFGEFAGRG